MKVSFMDDLSTQDSLHTSALILGWMTLTLHLMLGISGCERTLPKTAQISIKTIDVYGRPLSEISVSSADSDALWGYTDERGIFRGEITLQPARVHTLQLGTPEGYIFASGHSDQRLNESSTEHVMTAPLFAIDLSHAQSDAQLQYDFRAVYERAPLDYMFMIEGSKGDHVRMNGESITTLAQSGSVEFMSSGTPGKPITLEVGARSYQGVFASKREVYLLLRDDQELRRLSHSPRVQVLARAQQVKASKRRQARHISRKHTQRTRYRRSSKRAVSPASSRALKQRSAKRSTQHLNLNPHQRPEHRYDERQQARQKRQVVVNPIKGTRHTRSEARAKLREIEQDFRKTRRLFAREVKWIKSLSEARHGLTYFYAHRLLGEHYFRVSAIDRQRDSLEVAIRKGRYRHDPLVLLSLAQAYNHFKQYDRALSVLKHAEAKLVRAPTSVKVKVNETYAQTLRLAYLSGREHNPLKSDMKYIDHAIRAWYRVRDLAGASSSRARRAHRQIRALEELKVSSQTHAQSI